MRILILGGTGNIGTHFIDVGLSRGHQVAVFSRGKGEVELPKTVERLIGDRTNNLESLKGRDWDAVLDLATYTADWVKALGEAIGGRVKHYLFISTVSVYDRPELNEKTVETSQILETGATASEKHGASKVLCEREAQLQFQGRTVVLRPGYLVGPRDHIGFLIFWALRMQRGGEVLAPGDPRSPFQCIDIRDLAAFAIRLVEKRVTGIFNVVGPAIPATFGQMLQTVQATEPSSSKLTWVPAARVAAQADKDTWFKPLFWSWYSESGGQANIMRMSNHRALSEGLTLRPLQSTLHDTIAWYRQQPAEVQASFAPGYKRSHSSAELVSADILWNNYMQREKQILAEWHAGRTRRS